MNGIRQRHYCLSQPRQRGIGANESSQVLTRVVRNRAPAERAKLGLLTSPTMQMEEAKGFVVQAQECQTARFSSIGKAIQ